MSEQIVIIEDNPHNARLAEKLLRRADPPYEVHIAEDGESGYDLALETNPALVLVDLGLPDLDGQTVVAMLRQQSMMEKTPIIAFTAWPQDTAHEMATAYGCDGVITKPIDTRNFATQIQAFLSVANSTEDTSSADEDTQTDPKTPVVSDEQPASNVSAPAPNAEATADNPSSAEASE
jgi:DNA-binding response OmpR family regulator